MKWYTLNRFNLKLEIMKKIRLIFSSLFFILPSIIMSCSSDEDVPINADMEGSLQINITAPSDINIDDIIVTGPDGFRETLTTSQLLENLQPGDYKIKASIVFVKAEPISLAYRPAELEQIVAVNGNALTVNVNYILMPGSGKLWLGNQNATSGNKIVAFDQSALMGSGMANASVNLTNSITSPEGIAFDPVGNLWAVDGAGSIKMFNWNDLGSTNISPSRVLNISETPFSIAFDSDTTLWVTTSNKVIGFSKDVIFENSASPTYEITSPNFSGLKGLAFDGNNDLWLANAGEKNIIKINKDKLVASGSITPDVTITLKSLPPVVLTLSSPTSLAFDLNNNLLIGFFGPNTIVSLSPAERMASDNFTPTNQFNLPVFVLIEHMVCDEDNNFWLPYGEDFFSGINFETFISEPARYVIESPDLRYGSGVAIYPAPLNQSFNQN